eukprot:16938-Heterococcus_DN1.PRE.3
MLRAKFWPITARPYSPTSDMIAAHQYCSPCMASVARCHASNAVIYYCGSCNVIAMQGTADCSLNESF